MRVFAVRGALLGGHEAVFEVAFRAGGNAVHAADAVRVAHEVGVGYINVHGAGAGALTALLALGGIALDAEDAQHAEQPHASAAGAEIVAERAVNKEPQQQEEDDDATGQGEQLSVPHHGIVSGALQQPDDHAHGEEQVKGIAAQLQVALDAFRYLQAGQVEQTPELCHPVLGCSQLADPPAEEDSQQKHGGQHPLAYVFRVRGEAENQSGHEDGLYTESQNLNFAPFFSHGYILALYRA